MARQKLYKPLPVGCTDIATRLGVKPQTVQMWHWRGLLPEPDWTVSGAPAWDWNNVHEWARSTGRA
jgi:hypothetical protein